MTEEKRALVEEIKRVCLENYENGGDEIIETMTDEEIAAAFNSVQEAKDYCGMRVEDATNHRWGEDNDPELVRSENFKNWRDDPPTCILTGADGENPDDCTTHDHE